MKNIEPIIQQWESFVRNISPPSEQMSTKELREHAKKMLLVIADELKHHKIKKKQDDPNTSSLANAHGISRLEQGFSMSELALEYQALRKSVMTLFGQANPKIPTAPLEDFILFNEWLDRALHEAIISYSLQKEQQTRLFDTMLAASPDLSYILDLEGNFLYINNALSTLYQKPPHEILGKADYNWAMPQATDIREHIQTILVTKKKCHGEIKVTKSANTPEIFFEYVYAPVFDNDKKIIAIAGTARDITLQKKAEFQTWHNANYDYLTGLANRRRFHDKLNDAIEHTRRSTEAFALLFIDLDLFKEINDQFGHSGGDILLKKIARRIKTCVRKTDVVARMGGDEFTVIITNTKDIEQVKTITKKLLSTIKKPVSTKQGVINITASIGIAFFSPTDEEEPEQLLRKADKAMYVAKKLGGDHASSIK
ncbi:MAG: diguanylate cyclase [Legionellaceae bacterium]|nr:diguanylate cyclase [Legionellaceae bacterium]